VTGGTYTLLFERVESATVEVGALGDRHVPAGWYAYTGSALGSGGFARVDRHYELAAGDRETRHWHVDYLLGDSKTEMRGDVRSSGADVECAVARRLPDGPVEGFGASDCECRSHLAYDSDGEALRGTVAALHRRLAGE
jgi:Uri superfamily endonuclease